MNARYAMKCLTVIFIGIFLCRGAFAQETNTNEPQWYKISPTELRGLAEKGNADAQYEYAQRYEDGREVQRSYKDAILWYRKSAQQGNVKAQYRLGMRLNCLYSPSEYIDAFGDKLGRLFETEDKDAIFIRSCITDAESAKWMLMAAQQGYEPAYFIMGDFYLNGKGVPKDDVEAYKWINLAATQDIPARKLRDMLAKKLTPIQLAEAQRRSSVFVPKKYSQEMDNEGVPLPFGVKGCGTGFFITADGYLLTAGHVVENSSRIQVKTSRGMLPAKIIKADAANDIAILKVQGNFKPIPLAPSRKVKLGESVFTIGFPNVELQGFNPKLTKGEISSLTGMKDDPRLFQVSVPVQPGNSGGPLVDMSGNVIGILVLKLNEVKVLESTGSLPQNVNYAMKSSFILALLETFPDISNALPGARILSLSFNDLVKDVETATALVMVF